MWSQFWISQMLRIPLSAVAIVTKHAQGVEGLELGPESGQGSKSESSVDCQRSTSLVGRSSHPETSKLVALDESSSRKLETGHLDESRSGTFFLISTSLMLISVPFCRYPCLLRRNVLLSIVAMVRCCSCD
jgi:hypothetical protein